MADEALGGKAGVDGHKEHHVEVPEDVLEERDGRMGIEGHTDAHAGIADGVDGAVEVGAGLVVDGHHVGAGVGHLADEFLGLDDHQVHVRGLVADVAEGVHDREAEGDVGDEDAVHDVDMQPVGLAAIDHLHVAAEVHKVGRKERWGYEMVHCALYIRYERGGRQLAMGRAELGALSGV